LEWQNKRQKWWVLPWAASAVVWGEPWSLAFKPTIKDDAPQGLP